MKGRSLKFKCPACGCSRVEEIKCNAQAVSAITRLDSEGGHDHGQSVIGDGATDRYQCIRCGWIVMRAFTPVRDCVALAEWLKEQAYNREVVHGEGCHVAEGMEGAAENA